MAVNGEETLFWRKKDENDSGDSDTWDDTELIKAYDKAVAELQDGSHSHSVNCDTTDEIQTKKKKKKKKSKHENKKWKVGGKCLAIYSGDNLYYESEILSTNYNEKTVEVKFSYYGNEEEVEMKYLLPIESKADLEVVPDTLNYYNDNKLQSSEETNSTEDGKSKIQTNWRVSDICYVLNKNGRYTRAVINSFVSSEICMVTIIKSNKKKEVSIAQLHSSKPHVDKKSRNNARPRNATCYEQSTDIPQSLSDFPVHIPPPPPLRDDIPMYMPPPPQSQPRFSSSSFSYKPPSWFGGHLNNSFHNYSHTSLPQCPPLPVVPKDVISGSEEALANMLMSWYISGFHTGYYEGMSKFMQNNRIVEPNNEHRYEKKNTSNSSKKRWGKTLV